MKRKKKQSYPIFDRVYHDSEPIYVDDGGFHREGMAKCFRLVDLPKKKKTEIPDRPAILRKNWRDLRVH